MQKETVRRETVRQAQVKRAAKILKYLKKAYPEPKTELKYKTPFQLAVAVMLSAQCTDKLVNKVTERLFKKYKTPKDFAEADPATFTSEISQVSYFTNKAKHIIAAAKIVSATPTAGGFGGKLPRTEIDLVKLPGIGYKTAHVIMGELFESWEGIPTDTHVKRFAKKFDLTENNDLKKISKDLERLIPKKDWKYVNNGLVLYGRYICKAHKHDCSDHPLTKLWPQAGDRWPKAK
jgi:endonuclease III